MKPPKDQEFDDLMRDVTPLAENTTQRRPKHQLKIRQKRAHKGLETIKFAGLAPEVFKRKMPKINGHFHPDRVIDLHGMILTQAMDSAQRALNSAKQEGCLSLLIITGKGLSSPDGVGVIKKEVEDWLTHLHDPAIQAVKPAPKHLGGQGAFLVVFA